MATIYQTFQATVQKHGSRPAVYWRKHRIWHHLHYKEVEAMIDDFAIGLARLNLKAGDRAAILSENRPEWLIGDLALNKLGAVSVPIHITSNQPLIEFILNDSGSGFLFVSEGLLIKHEDFIKSLLVEKQVRVILFDKSYVLKTHWEKIYPSLLLYSNLLKTLNEPKEAVYNELATIVYTSGTTDAPKGVMLSNENLLSNLEGVFQRFKITEADKFLSFLPLSHILERTLGSYIAIAAGASIAYAENIKQLSRNLREIKPTIIIGVPRIFEKTKEKVFANIRNKNVLIQRLFFTSLKKDDHSVFKKIADFLIYKKIRNLFGGHLRFAVSGGAAIHERILRFYNTVGIIITEGYGLTETSPIVACNTVEARSIGSVGKILPGVEVMIADDKEILTRSKSLMLGYWNRPDLSSAVINEQGWFKTGDLGFLNKDNCLTIIGRKKDIIVTSNGKNIFPEKLENTINLSPYIFQCLVVGHKQNSLCALIVPDFEIIKQDFKGQEANLQKLIEKELAKANSQLVDYEKIQKFKILEQPFTVEANELTPTLKIKRHFIEAKYQGVIADLYK